MIDAAYNLRLDDADYAYILSDDSMINARIFPGDMVLFKRQTTAENGDIVLAQQGDRARIGVYTRHKDCEMLTPASPRHMSIVSDLAEPSFMVMAKAVAFVGDLMRRPKAELK